MQKKGVFLGVHTGHDRGATLIKNGEVKLHVPEDRLDRVKHSESQDLPFQAISRILEHSNLTLNDIDAIGLSCVNRQSNAYLAYYQSAFEQHFELPCPIIHLASHHLCHALCCLLLSEDPEVFAYVYDGAGDLNHESKMESETLFRISPNDHEVLHQRLQDYHESFSDKTQFFYAEMMYGDYAQKQISLGKKFNQFTSRCGFGPFEDGKTMGLAPYGQPLFDVRQFVPKNLDFSLTISDLLGEVAKARVSSGQSYFEFDRTHKADLAATIQTFLEHSMLSLTNTISKEFGVMDLSLVGGVALNCITNHKIAASESFATVRPFPAAGDDGQSIGAALHALRCSQSSPILKRSLPIYSGPLYTDTDAKKALESHGLTFVELSETDLITTIAETIADGGIAALHRGRSEVGPRALGHRSILASATHTKMKDILNEKVKFREKFRPYAPMVSIECASEYFDLEGSSPHMMFACSVHEDKRPLLPSITHIDGTARVQTVSAEDEGFVHAILNTLGELTGHPVMINTSFNLAGEPVVETPDDAIKTYLRSGIDILVLGRFLVRRSPHK